MHDPDVQHQIRELDKVRAQLRLWRTLLSLAFLVITLGSVGIIVNAANGLFRPGPRQEEFTQALTTNLQRDVVPNIQSLAARTLTEMRPQVETSFNKLNDRVPELSQASMTEMDTLQKNVSSSSEKVLHETLGTMLVSKETKIKQMFPDITDDKVKTALNLVGEEAQNRLLGAHDTLLSQHTNRLNSIMAHLSQIQATERVHPQSDKANWEMAITLLDLMRDQVKALEPASSSSSTRNASATRPTIGKTAPDKALQTRTFQANSNKQVSRPQAAGPQTSRPQTSRPQTARAQAAGSQFAASQAGRSQTSTPSTTNQEAANGTQSSGY